MERPANISPAAWKLLIEHLEEFPGTHLLEAGIATSPELLRGIVVTVPLEDAEEECFFDETAAAALAGGEAHVRMPRMGDRKEYLVPRAILLEALRGDIDWLEKESA